MSQEKELNFFSRDERWNLGLDWYGRQFDAETAVRGETSPSYTDRGKFPDSVSRMAEVIPDARLIYVVRDPVDRILADYAHRVSEERETRSWSAVVDSIDGSGYLGRSRYFWQLKPYLEHFPRERILVVGQHRLRDERRDTLREVFRFVNVDEAFWSSSFEKLIHETDRRRTRNSVGRVLAKVADPLLKRLPGDLRYRISHAVYLPVSRRAVKPRIDPAVRRQLLSLLEDDIRQLQQLFGSDSHVGREARAWLGRES